MRLGIADLWWQGRDSPVYSCYSDNLKCRGLLSSYFVATATIIVFLPVVGEGSGPVTVVVMEGTEELLTSLVVMIRIPVTVALPTIDGLEANVPSLSQSKMCTE